MRLARRSRAEKKRRDFSRNPRAVFSPPDQTETLLHISRRIPRSFARTLNNAPFPMQQRSACFQVKLNSILRRLEARASIHACAASCRESGLGKFDRSRDILRLCDKRFRILRIKLNNCTFVSLSFCETMCAPF